MEKYTKKVRQSLAFLYFLFYGDKFGCNRNSSKFALPDTQRIAQLLLVVEIGPFIVEGYGSKRGFSVFP